MRTRGGISFTFPFPIPYIRNSFISTWSGRGSLNLERAQVNLFLSNGKGDRIQTFFSFAPLSMVYMERVVKQPLNRCGQSPSSFFHRFSHPTSISASLTKQCEQRAEIDLEVCRSRAALPMWGKSTRPYRWHRKSRTNVDWTPHLDQFVTAERAKSSFQFCPSVWILGWWFRVTIFE